MIIFSNNMKIPYLNKKKYLKKKKIITLNQ